MEARFMIENPQSVVCEMKIKMTVKEWEDLRDQLQKSFPSWRLSNAITDLLAQARKVFYETHEV